MTAVLTGYAVVGLAIVIGYIVGRTGILGAQGRYVLSRLTFFVLSPFLLFVVLADADVTVLFSSLLPVSLLAALSMFLVYALVARFILRRSLGATVIGSLGAGYVNGNNIGLPIATYLLGSGAFSAPIILIQLLLFTPVVLTILDAISSGAAEIRLVLRRTARNPMILGSLLGTIVAFTGVELPPAVMDPARLIADAGIPVLLIGFGMSLHGSRVLTTRGTRADVIVATALKLLAMPAVAWVIARFGFGMDGHDLFAVVLMAALPSAQNVFNYAQRYEVGETIARDTVFLTTIGCIPVIFGVVLLLG
ncbi:AEC family transporter [Microbacterium sp. Marseille-Q6965]|uniref:AEC family transporter n=1 Tax=Microbacterium sp. Marseille-Q6965 TaxID=2965072 RepID=UPI0021B7B526|nr:AEC family transporter [Microbacterium sp. Marseille-Q6965]